MLFHLVILSTLTVNALAVPPCSDGWTLYSPDNTCLKVNDKKSYPDATAQCQQDGGSLVIIRTDDKNSFVNGLVSQNKPQSQVWIGIRDQTTSQNFEYVTGEKLTDKSYTNWHTVEPNNFKVSCVALLNSADGQWNDENCHVNNFFVCQMPAKPATCSCGQTLHERDNTCYKAYAKDTYSNAMQKCVMDGGHLATIRDAHTNTFVGNLVRETFSSVEKVAWIGIRDEVGNQQFRYVDGGAVSGFSSWGSGEPNNRMPSCVTLNAESHRNGKWNDDNCHRQYAFVCQFSSRPAPCHSGWRLFSPDNTCLQVNAYDTFDNAATHCQNQGSSLVLVRDANKNAFTLDLTDEKYPEKSPWIGIRDLGTNQDFEYITGEKLTSTSFTNWAAGEPNNYQVSCVTVLSYKDGRWNDDTCVRERPFVCQMDALSLS